jgi:hypothetical protein
LVAHFHSGNAELVNDALRLTVAARNVKRFLRTKESLYELP